MASRIAVMMNGRLLQVAGPETLYADPDHIEVAEFVGTPKINVVAGEIGQDGAARHRGTVLAGGFPGDGAVRLAVRPEHLEIGEEPYPGSLAARLERVEFQGSETLAHLVTESCDDVVARLAPSSTSAIRPGRAVHLHARPDRWLAFDRQGLRLRPRATSAPARPPASPRRPALAHA